MTSSTSNLRTEASPIKLLILGFSCTELGTGYTKPLMPALKAECPGLTIFRCGLGGLSPPVIPSFLAHLHANTGPFTHVVLEISTSVYQWLERVTPQTMTDVVRDIFQSCRELGIAPFVLMLYRRDHKVPRVRFNDILRRECTFANVPYLDLAENFLKVYGADFANSILSDVVHTTPTGGRLQADLSQWRLLHWLSCAITIPSVDRPIRFRRVSLPVDALVGDDLPRTSFKRRDFTCSCVVVKEGQSLSLQFDEPRRIMGVSFVHGPSSGFFQITPDGDHQSATIVPAFDKRCYYSRVGFRAFNAYIGRWVRSLRFDIVDGHQEVSLLKGVRDDGPADIRLIDVVELQKVDQDT